MLPNEFSITIPDDDRLSDTQKLLNETHDCLKVISDGRDVHLFFKIREVDEEIEEIDETETEEKDRYYCNECERNHFNDSAIGIKHFEHR